MLSLIEGSAVDGYWPDIESLIVAACARSGGRYEAHHVHDYFRRGVWQLWLIHDAEGIAFVGATEVIRYPTGLQSLLIRIGTGRDMRTWLHHMDEVLSRAKAHGCAKAEGEFREGLARALTGWTKTHVVLERDL
jgi:hypothetical protein